ncbi:MAG: GNAT family N-acetyltransferase [Breznakia sp.]
MIVLRKLQNKDAPLMLEWMHEEKNKKIFQVDFESKTLADVQAFIQDSFSDTNHNFAIVDESDEYVGTITLKNIDMKNRHGEYAISLRNKAHGQGVAKAATALLLQYAFEDLDLNRVYLCVQENNERAKTFYEKFGFVYEGCFRKHVFNHLGYHDLLWYGILKEEYYG